MLSEIKQELLNSPEKLKDVLEHFGFANIVIRPNYLQCGRDNDINSSKKAIRIKLQNNQYLYVNDYARAIDKELFSYISEQKRLEYSQVLNEIKSVLHITDYYEYFGKQGIFGGFYERIKKQNTNTVNTHSETVLDQYIKCGNLRFLRDNISITTQNFFNLRYDVESQGIVIPIYNQLGQLMGVKIRCNYDVEDGELKYFYLLPCAMSQTLYGYSHNYNSLVGNTVYIFEAEKSVMQCHSYGIRNCVALGSGTIGLKQIQMIYELNPKRVMFMHDTEFELENIMRNINCLKSYSRFSNLEIGYWDYFGKGYENKISPSDLGKDGLTRIMNTEIKMIGDELDEEEL